MTERSEDGRLIVRLFPDYAGTVLWFGGAVDYAEVHLSHRLQNDLRAWDSFHRSRLDPDLLVHAKADEREFAATGTALARRLADELGLGVEIHLVIEGRQVFRSPKPPTNSRAASALHERSEQQAIEARAVAEKLDGGRWYAYAPLSGARSDPTHDRQDLGGPGNPAEDSPPAGDGSTPRGDGQLE
jgi:hypothetical protein